MCSIAGGGQSQSKFEDVKYFKFQNNEIVSKNLFKELESKYREVFPDDKKEDKEFKFLKQYLTIHRSELFFADKIIFIEGDTERILLPAMLQKFDQRIDESRKKLLSQNISIIDVGANSKVFDPFLKFLDIKTLIITDLDSVKEVEKTKADGSKYKVNEACPVIEGEKTSNASINHFLKDRFSDFNTLKTLSQSERMVNNNILIAYQTEENDYPARSFEDAFISINLEFLQQNKESFDSLQHKSELVGDKFYDIANKCIKSKPDFAMDILLNDTEDLTWKVPRYIIDGLEWLNNKEINNE